MGAKRKNGNNNTTKTHMTVARFKAGWMRTFIHSSREEEMTIVCTHGNLIYGRPLKVKLPISVVSPWII